MIAHCLFEQSGTFKNEFKKLGIEAYDYDKQNQFNETDYKLDLFDEIQEAYAGNPTIFDNITSDDIIVAFYPCIRFCDSIRPPFQGKVSGVVDWDLEKKLEYDRYLFQSMYEYYDILCMLVLVCLRKNLKLIIENPKSTPTNLLDDYWCIKSSVVDTDRSAHGDYFRKPTQYWFINCNPKNNFIFGQGLNKNNKSAEGVRDKNGINRSLIHPDYARWFIKTYIL